MKKKSKNLIVPFLIAFSFILPAFHILIKFKYEHDVRSNTVKLLNKQGSSCTGTQIIAPSGTKYILTAAHCDVLQNEEGKILVEAEGKRPIELKVIEDSDTTDLMLLEGHPGLSGIKIGSEPTKNSFLRAYTHGAGLATFEANGHLVQQKDVQIFNEFINNPQEEKECASKPKNKVVEINNFFFTMKACVLQLNANVTTLNPIMPGSSGGAAVVGNKVVGVISAIGGGFTFIVRFEELKAFLAPY